MAEAGTLLGGWAKGMGALGTSLFNPEKGREKMGAWAQTYTPELVAQADHNRRMKSINRITEPITPTTPDMGSVGYTGSTPIDPNIAMQNIDLSTGVNGRQFEQVQGTTPLTKKGTPKVKQRSYGEEGVELPIVKIKEGLFKKPEFYLRGGEEYHDPESDTTFSGESTSNLKIEGPSQRAIKGKGRRSGEAYVDIVGGDFDFAAMENIKPI